MLKSKPRTSAFFHRTIVQLYIEAKKFAFVAQFSKLPCHQQRLSAHHFTISSMMLKFLSPGYLFSFCRTDVQLYDRATEMLFVLITAMAFDYLHNTSLHFQYDVDIKPRKSSLFPLYDRTTLQQKFQHSLWFNCPSICSIFNCCKTV